MLPSSVTEIIPLQTDSTGVILIGGTRVTLETEVGAFRDAYRGGNSTVSVSKFGRFYTLSVTISDEPLRSRLSPSEKG